MVEIEKFVNSANPLNHSQLDIIQKLSFVNFSNDFTNSDLELTLSLLTDLNLLKKSLKQIYKASNKKVGKKKIKLAQHINEKIELKIYTLINQ